MSPGRKRGRACAKVFQGAASVPAFVSAPIGEMKTDVAEAGRPSVCPSLPPRPDPSGGEVSDGEASGCPIAGLARSTSPPRTPQAPPQEAPRSSAEMDGALSAHSPPPASRPPVTAHGDVGLRGTPSWAVTCPATPAVT